MECLRTFLSFSLGIGPISSQIPSELPLWAARTYSKSNQGKRCWKPISHESHVWLEGFAGKHGYDSPWILKHMGYLWVECLSVVFRWYSGWCKPNSIFNTCKERFHHWETGWCTHSCIQHQGDGCHPFLVHIKFVEDVSIWGHFSKLQLEHPYPNLQKPTGSNDWSSHLEIEFVFLKWPLIRPDLVWGSNEWSPFSSYQGGVQRSMLSSYVRRNYLWIADACLQQDESMIDSPIKCHTGSWAATLFHFDWISINLWLPNKKALRSFKVWNHCSYIMCRVSGNQTIATSEIWVLQQPSVLYQQMSCFVMNWLMIGGRLIEMTMVPLEHIWHYIIAWRGWRSILKSHTSFTAGIWIQATEQLVGGWALASHKSAIW